MKHVLFVCNHNAGRSQMAQAFFERYAPDDVRAVSAGTQPNDAIWPEVIEAMSEVGIDLSSRRPRKLDLEIQLLADLAVTMGCGDACPFVPTRVEEWDLPDPAGRPLEEVRAVRNEIERQVKALIDERIDEIRADSTAHQMRIARLLPPLYEEFGSTHEPEDIRACADKILSAFDDAPVRSFVFSLVHRKTRECLRNGECPPSARAA
jgi:arsenate reductase (thioredoxin)